MNKLKVFVCYDIYMRLFEKNQISIYQLAVNVTTAVKMFEEYYSHVRVGSKEFTRTMTKGNQTSSRKVLPF